MFSAFQSQKKYDLQELPFKEITFQNFLNNLEKNNFDSDITLEVRFPIKEPFNLVQLMRCDQHPSVNELKNQQQMTPEPINIYDCLSTLCQLETLDENNAW